MTDRYLIQKVLTPNDVGETGSHQSGIAVPKRLIQYFPHLDSKELNPECYIFVKNNDSVEYRWRYIYYNNRLHDIGTRNEYRLTQISQFLKSQNNVTSGDILLLEFKDTFHLNASVEKSIVVDVDSTKKNRVLQNSANKIVINNKNSWTVSRIRI